MSGRPPQDDEPARLEALRALRLLDVPDAPSSPPGAASTSAAGGRSLTPHATDELREAFARIVRLASRLPGASGAAICLVEETRAVFLATEGGLPRSLARADSLCAETIHFSDGMMVLDARADARFCDTPLVQGPPFIRSYWGQTLHAPSGHAVGTLFAFAVTPTPADQATGAALVDLARLAEELIRQRAALAPADRAHARTSHRRLETLINSLNAGILLEDEHRRVVLVNPRLCQMFKLPNEPDALVGASSAVTLEQGMHQVREGQQWRARVDELSARRIAVSGDVVAFTGGRITERDYMPLSVDGQNRGHLWVYRDVTVRRVMEAERARVAERESELLVSLRHEIGNPVRLIAGLLESLSREAMEPKQRGLASAAAGAARDLVARLAGILDPAGLDAGAAPVARTRVLLVEDSAAVLTPAADLLDRAGCDVTSARGGAAALAAFVPGTFDVVLMDCQMPGMDGFETTTRLRQLPGAQHLPIIALTASALPEERERCRSVGMDDCLSKPVDLQELRQTLGRHVRPAAPARP